VGWGYGRDDFGAGAAAAFAHVSSVDGLREVLGV